MATTPASTDETQDTRVQAVFDDIRRTRGSDFINAFWRHLAFDAALLESTWAEAKRTMVAPSALDPLTKELIYIAVSVANGCSYCVHSHTAAARAVQTSSTPSGAIWLSTLLCSNPPGPRPSAPWSRRLRWTR